MTLLRRTGAPEVLNSDALIYGGSGLGNPDGAPARPMPRHGRPYSVELTLPPLGTIFLTLIEQG